MYIDTHCHLDFDDYDQDREAVIKRAKESGVDYIINIGSSLQSSRNSVELAKNHDFIYASVGIHPHDASEVDDKALDEIKELAKFEKVVAIGEVGLDYYRNLSPQDAQKQIFVKLIRLAKELDLPLVIHDREAHKDTLEILKSECKKPIKGVLHCFSGDIQNAKEFLDLGLLISFTCNVTFKNAHILREVAKSVPIQKLLLETDAPYLAPQQHRGQRNEPVFIEYLARALAELKGISFEEVCRITSENAKSFFKIK